MKRLVLTLVVCIVLLAPTGMVSAAPNGNAAELPQIQQVVFIDYAQHNSPPPSATDQDRSFRLLRNASWAALPVSYLVNTTGAPSGAFSAVTSAFETWDEATSADVFNDTVETTIKTGYTKDGDNIVSWDPIDGSGGIVAIASVWFRVFPGGWQVVEFDIVFDSEDPWGIGESGKFDVQNVATHEVGHTLFLDDLYLWKTVELTMYGYVALDETKKQDLGVGDVLGVRKLYGK